MHAKFVSIPVGIYRGQTNKHSIAFKIDKQIKIDKQNEIHRLTTEIDR